MEKIVHKLNNDVFTVYVDIDETICFYENERVYENAIPNYENLSKINGEYKGNDLVTEVTNFIAKDKRRPICTPQSEQ